MPKLTNVALWHHRDILLLRSNRVNPGRVDAEIGSLLINFLSAALNPQNVSRAGQS